jgi:hypothetical protein
MRPNKEGVIFLFVVLISSGIILYYTKVRSNRIDKYGIYQIASVFRKDHSKSGTGYYFTFKYKGGSYEGNYLSSNIDSFFLIKFLPENPKEWIIISKRLPPCITLEDGTPNGWENLPAKCN